VSVARGSVIADRFEVTGDIDAHLNACGWARKGWWRFEGAAALGRGGRGARGVRGTALTLAGRACGSEPLGPGRRAPH
jgi:hypothetical protein